eukprot:7696344-Ditylum_brightwellii.AAC.1
MTTAFGLGPHQNWHNLIAAVHGIEQGATDGPSGWMFISNIILKCYLKLAVGHTIIDPTNTLQIENKTDMFIDDNTLTHGTGKFKEDKETLTPQVQSDAQMWGRLLWVSGRQLKFSKSSYSI